MDVTPVTTRAPLDNAASFENGRTSGRTTHPQDNDTRDLPLAVFASVATVLILLCFGCSDKHEPDTGIDSDASQDQPGFRYAGDPVELPSNGITLPSDALSNGCYAIDAAPVNIQDTRWLTTRNGTPTFSGRTRENGQPFYFKASDLGTYLLYAPSLGYLVSDSGRLAFQEALDPTGTRQDDASSAEWTVINTEDANRYLLKNRLSGQFMGASGQNESDTPDFTIGLMTHDGCTPHPELSLDAEGTVTRTQFDDGDLFGIVDTHSHIFSNLGFGPGVHGAPFHRLGVEHALNDCESVHGSDGRRDLWGYFTRGGVTADIAGLITAITTGETEEFNHHVDGYPNFTDWPSRQSKTHQTQYYRWLERAWMGGLRLVVQHAVANRVICELQASVHPDPDTYQCNEMQAIKRSIEQTYAMERYIDAQAGGEGRGFFKVVTSPSQARDVIKAGKLAVILGIETSNLFDCLSTLSDDAPPCDIDHVDEQLTLYHDLGVRALFPVHKFDNGFTAGDGHRGVLELANFINGAQWSSYVQECDVDAPGRFDQGELTFGGLNKPREQFSAPPAVDLSDFSDSPVVALAPFLGEITKGPLDGDWCQNHGLTPLGEHLLVQMMKRGMIIEFDHFPRRSYARAFEIVTQNNYPPMASHGETFGGRVYEANGLAAATIGRCHTPGDPDRLTANIRDHVQQLSATGNYPAIGFSFDLGGFSSYPRPRFGDMANCRSPQETRLTYPFSSVAGDTVFTQPKLADRTIDFNTEGFVHIGMLPELIQDARLGGATEADLEPLFRSAEGYIRLWERSEARAQTLRP